MTTLSADENLKRLVKTMRKKATVRYVKTKCKGKNIGRPKVPIDMYELEEDKF